MNDVFNALEAGRVDGRMVLDIGLSSQSREVAHREVTAWRCMDVAFRDRPDAKETLAERRGLRGSDAAEPASADSSRTRWAYAALHEFDFPWLYERRPHWDIVLILASIGGAVLSFTTLWPMCKRLARHGRRIAHMLRSSHTRQISGVGAD